ncbi:MAG TPA: GNAT family N-acetyltransferase [Dehalococcoidia bacterium]|nr:GNAT family N-acetyltransferase [Dehalococcoidia bacterium]
MPIELGPDQRAALRPLFQQYPYLHGCVAAVIEGGMGRAYAAAAGAPAAALLLLDFSILGGDAAAAGAADLVRLLEPGTGSAIVPNEAWRRLLQANYHGELHDDPREAFTTGHFDREQLRRFCVALPDGFDLVRVRPDQVAAFAELEVDLVRNFTSHAAFAERGVGFGVLHEGRFVAGCSSFAIGGGTLEIEIDTHPDFRRRGLARAAGAAMVLWCLDHGLEPCWDAANPMSSALARQLGFISTGPYVAYRLH